MTPDIDAWAGWHPRVMAARMDGFAARVRLPYAEVIRHGPDGIPYLAPEIVLLFKAKGARDKDVADLERVLPRLGGGRRRWLADTLALVHPGHPWAALAGG